VCKVDNGIFNGRYERLFVTELNNKYLPPKFFLKFLSGSLLQLLLQHGNFSNIDISQGDVAK